MIKASPAEIQLHYSVVSYGNQFFSELTKFFSEHLLSCLNNWYGHAVFSDPSIAYQAVYETLKNYCNHPRMYNPEHGSLARFLELGADRNIQRIFEKEKHPVRINSRERILAKYFDNERDVELAKLLLKNKKDVCAYISILNTGGYRIGHLLYELNRHRDRISNLLHQALSSIHSSPSSTLADSSPETQKPSRSRTQSRGRRMKPSLILHS